MRLIKLRKEGGNTQLGRRLLESLEWPWQRSMLALNPCGAMIAVVTATARACAGLRALQGRKELETLVKSVKQVGCVAAAGLLQDCGGIRWLVL
jgi:hypothetical protein